MPIAGEFIVDLVDTTPDGSTERVRILDDHIRLLKHVLRVQFPNFTAAAVTPTVNDLNRVSGAHAASGIQFLNAKAAANGYAGLDADAKVPLAQLPTNVLPAGTRLLFQQTAAPTGWTKETNASFNDTALRIVTGTVGAVAGTLGFSTVFVDNYPSNIAFGESYNIDDRGGLVFFNSPSHVHGVNLSIKYADVIVAVKS